MARIEFRGPLTIGDLFAALPGIFLLAGYCLALLIQFQEPATSVEIDEQRANYQKKVVMVPSPHAEGESSKGSSPYVVYLPQLEADGRPRIDRIHRVITGRGRPMILESTKEIILPIVGDPEVVALKEDVQISPGPYEPEVNPVFATHSFVQVSYAANIAWRGTGEYEIEKSVVFNPEIDPDKLGVEAGVAGSILTTIYVLYRLTRPVRG